MKPIIVGVAGGTASGKTSVCEYLLKKQTSLYQS
jgi:uridine kinase